MSRDEDDEYRVFLNNNHPFRANHVSHDVLTEVPHGVQHDDLEDGLSTGTRKRLQLVK